MKAGGAGGSESLRPLRGLNPDVGLSGAELGNSHKGSASINLDSGAGNLCVFVTTAGPTPTKLHIHEAPPGSAASAVVEVPIGPAGTGCVTDATNLRRVEEKPAGFYIDVHTAPDDAEHFRGRFGKEPEKETAPKRDEAPSP